MHHIHNKQTKSTKLSPLPQHFHQLPNLQPLPLLNFHLEAAQPLTQSHILKITHKDNTMLQNNKNKYEEQLTKLRKQLQLLYADYLTQKEQHQYWKKQYQEGEILYHQLQQQNHRLIKQIQILSKKKLNYRNNGNNRKQVPVIKITVPSHKSQQLDNSNTHQSVYRQLRSASQQLTSMKKLLQSQKQKAEHTTNLANKTIQQLTQQNKQLIIQNNKIRQQLTTIKVNKNSNNNSSSNYDRSSMMNTANIQQNNRIYRLQEQFNRLKRIHDSCQVLIHSKDNQINSLKNRMEKLQSNTSKYTNNTLMTAQNRQYQYQQTPQKNLNNLIKHLHLSTKQIQDVQQLTKNLVNKFIHKITQLKTEIDRLTKIGQSQKFQLSKVYQLLNQKKHLIEIYQQDISAAKKLKTQQNFNNSGSSFQKSPHSDHSSEYFKSILRDRRSLNH